MRDDTFVKSVMVSLLVVIISGLVYFGRLTNRVEVLEREIEEVRTVNYRLIRIEVLTENSLASIAKMSDNIVLLAANQQKKNNIIDKAAMHVSNREVHK